MQDEPARKRDESVSSWAYIYEQPGADPVADRFVIERGGQKTSLVPIPDESAAASVALGLIDEGAELIELCGAFGLAEAARVVEAVNGRVPVGHVTFAVDSVTGAASYKARFEERVPQDNKRSGRTTKANKQYQGVTYDSGNFVR